MSKKTGGAINLDKVFLLGLIISFCILAINKLVDMPIVIFYTATTLLVLYVRSFLGKVAFEIRVNAEQEKITFLTLRCKAISYSFKDLSKISIRSHIEFLMPKSKIYWHSPDFTDANTIKLLETLSPFVKIKWGLLSLVSGIIEFGFL